MLESNSFLQRTLSPSSQEGNHRIKRPLDALFPNHFPRVFPGILSSIRPFNQHSHSSTFVILEHDVLQHRQLVPQHKQQIQPAGTGTSTDFDGSQAMPVRAHHVDHLSKCVEAAVNNAQAAQAGYAGRQRSRDKPSAGRLRVGIPRRACLPVAVAAWRGLGGAE